MAKIIFRVLKFKMIRLRSILIFLLIMLIRPATSQDVTHIFKDVVLRIDTSEYSLLDNPAVFLDEHHLAFRFTDPEPVCEVLLTSNPGFPVGHVALLPSGDFDLVDSLIVTGPDQARFKVRFNDLVNTDYLKFVFRSADSSGINNPPAELKLLPWTQTWLKLYLASNELYIGEEKVFELLTNNIENINFDRDWVETEHLNYRISKNFNQIRLHVIPKSLGRHTLVLNTGVKKPILDESGQVVYDLPPIEQEFSVRQSRLQFLNVDRNEVTLDDSTRSQGIEIQIENNRLLQMQKTYRIESQEEPGGTLIAELFTKSEMTNNRVLCVLRVYNYHRKSDGYLYIKDGDRPRFITNFEITPKTTVRRISILRSGNWTQNLSVYPGETISLKIEGEGLHKANFTFEQMEDITSSDSLIRGEHLALYRFKVPIDVSLRRLELFNHAQPTGRSLNVKEFQLPRPFDYLWINYRGIRQSIADLPSTVLVDGTLQNLIFGSEPDMIDSDAKLYGKQYLKMDITVTGRRGELLEVKTIDNIVICPGVNSPRSEYYNRKDCGMTSFDLNKYFRKKTSSLEIWSQIKLRISHQTDKYSGGTATKEVEIILRKPYSFDVEVSFPAGLITVSKQPAGQQIGQLTGISIAMIGQFTFYHPEKINVQRPYKVGAGFLALNTFNFSDDAQNRDIAMVLLGSLYPTTKDTKLTFPLYFGGGYQLKGQKWFVLIGPGIRIRL